MVMAKCPVPRVGVQVQLVHLSSAERVHQDGNNAPEVLPVMQLESYERHGADRYCCTLVLTKQKGQVVLVNVPVQMVLEQKARETRQREVCLLAHRLRVSSFPTHRHIASRLATVAKIQWPTAVA